MTDALGDEDLMVEMLDKAHATPWEYDPEFWEDQGILLDNDDDDVRDENEDELPLKKGFNELDGLIDISKVDARKGLVFGWATVIRKDGQTVLDRERDMIEDEWELEKSAYAYVATSGDMGDNHLRKGVGRLIESIVITDDKKAALGLPLDSPTGWWVGFKISDADVMKGFVDGLYSGFSVHGKGRRIKKGAPSMKVKPVRTQSKGAAALARYREVRGG